MDAERDGRVTDRKTRGGLLSRAEERSLRGRDIFNSAHSGAEWRAFCVPLWHGLSIEVRLSRIIRSSIVRGRAAWRVAASSGATSGQAFTVPAHRSALARARGTRVGEEVRYKVGRYRRTRGTCTRTTTLSRAHAHSDARYGEIRRRRRSNRRAGKRMSEGKMAAATAARSSPLRGKASDLRIVVRLPF